MSANLYSALFFSCMLDRHAAGPARSLSCFPDSLYLNDEKAGRINVH